MNPEENQRIYKDDAELKEKLKEIYQKQRNEYNDEDFDKWRATYSDVINNSADLKSRNDYSHLIFNININSSFLYLTSQSSIKLNNSIFLGKVDFMDAKFSSEVNFLGSEFSREVNFSLSEFSDEVNFLGSKFLDKVNFSESEFSREVNFSLSKFLDKVNFSESEFSSVVYFSGSEFSREVYFSWSKFSREVNFRGSTFSSVVYFLGSEFSREVYFSESKFSDKVNFSNSTFQGISNFSHATFKKVFFQSIIFKNSPKFDFTNALAEFILFSKDKYCSEKLKLNLKNLTCDHIDTADEIIKGENYQTYQVLKDHALRKSDRISALKYHKEEMDMFYKQVKPITSEKILLCVEKWSNNFGLSWLRPLGWLLLINFLFALFLLRDKNDFSNCLEMLNILVNFFLDSIFTLPYEKNPHSELLVSFLYYFKNLINVFLIYQLVSALRKYSRKL